MSESADIGHRLYLDEDALVLTTELRKVGWNVYRCTQSGLTGRAATDPRQLKEATDLERTLITFNRRDFQLVHEAWTLAGGEHHGILSIRGGLSSDPGGFAEAIDALLRGSTPAVQRNSMLVWHPMDQVWRSWND
jgi:hypothetical protein